MASVSPFPDGTAPAPAPPSPLPSSLPLPPATMTLVEKVNGKHDVVTHRIIVCGLCGLAGVAVLCITALEALGRTPGLILGTVATTSIVALAASLGAIFNKPPTHH